MMTAKGFIAADNEYIVCDAAEGYVPGAAGIELLAHRRHGVGADRVLVVRQGRHPAFRLYAADGTELEPEKIDYMVFACYLKQKGMVLTAVELVHILGDRALVATQDLQLASFDIHVTENFCQKMRTLDAKDKAMIC